MLRLAVLVLLFAPAAFAQVQPPEAFLGYPLGERFTLHHRVVDYVEHVASASDRVELVPYGESVEGRPLLTLVVSAPDVDADAVRRSNLSAAEGNGTPDKAIVWLSYNVHGNESVSTEASMQTLYTLATSSEAEAWLQDVVVILDPCINPDGRDRYVTGYQQRRGAHPNADPLAREHNEPWPGGRTNHYLFDLNRDWAWGTQPETRARLALYNTWLPHVHVDFHEQGVNSPYFFAPAAEPFHDRITDWQRTFQGLIGAGNAEVFDRQGWLYFTRQVFDLFYPGYGDTWPTFNGAIGMTYEQGGSGRAGLAIETAEGDTLRLSDRIRNHNATGLATVATTARNAERVRTEFAQYFASPPQGNTRAYAVRGNAGTLEALTELLDLQGIRYGWASGSQMVQGVRYGGGLASPSGVGRVTVEPGDLVVSLDQPKGTLAAVLFEPSPPLADSLTYDVTAWALPYVYGVEGMALRADVATGGVSPLASPTMPVATRPYAYVARWKSAGDARLLAQLLDAGVGVRIVSEPFTSSGVSYERGTLVITRAGNQRLGDRFDGLVRETAQAAGRSLESIGSGFVEEGDDIGSGSVGFVRAPNVLVLAEPPVSSYAMGEVWHTFDQTWGYPATFVRAEDLNAAALNDADVLVMPSGSYGGWLSESRVETLVDWVRAGGRIVALEGAVAALARHEDFGLKTRNSADADTSADARLQRYADRDRASATDSNPGSIYHVQLDNTHPLGFGYPDHTYTLKRGTRALEFLEDGWNVGVIREGAPVSGFAGVDTGDRLKDTLVFGVTDIGRGELVVFLDDPLFRGFWANGELLFANAVFGLAD
ncbi:MAG: M14 family metallopeptidase [Rubricoccaceae bacterium]